MGATEQRSQSGVLTPPDTSKTAPEPCCADGCGYLVRAPSIYCPLHRL